MLKNEICENKTIIIVKYNDIKKSIILEDYVTLRILIMKIREELNLKEYEKYLFYLNGKNLKFLNQNLKVSQCQNSDNSNQVIVSVPTNLYNQNINTSPGNFNNQVFKNVKNSSLSFDLCSKIYSFEFTEKIFPFYAYFTNLNSKVLKLNNLKIPDKVNLNLFLNFLYYFDKKLEIDSLSLSSKHFNLLNDEQYFNLSTFNNLLKLKITNFSALENKYALDNLNFKLFFNYLKILVLQDVQIDDLNTILKSVKNITKLKLKDVSINTNYENKNNSVMPLNYLRHIILEYKHINLFFKAIEFLSKFQYSNELYLKIKIDSIDIEDKFTFKRLDSYLIFDFVNKLEMNLNSLVSDFDNKFINISKVLNRIKIKAYSELDNSHLSRFLFQNRLQNLNYLMIKPFQLNDIDSTKEMLENFNKGSNGNYMYSIMKLEKSITIIRQNYFSSYLLKSSNDFILSPQFSISNIKCIKLPFFEYDEKLKKVKLTGAYKKNIYTENKFIEFFDQFFTLKGNYSKILELENFQNLKCDLIIKILEIIKMEFFNLERIKLYNIMMNLDFQSIIHTIFINNNKGLKNLKMNNLKFLENTKLDFFKVITEEIHLPNLEELIISKINNFKEVNDLFINSKTMPKLTKLSFTSIKDITLININLKNLKIFKLKNAKIDLDELVKFLDIHNNKLEELTLDLEINLFHLFSKVKFSSLIKLKILENKYKYPPNLRQSLIEVLYSPYLTEFPFIMENISNDLQTFIYNKFILIKRL